MSVKILTGMAVYNSEKTLPEVLHALAGISYPKKEMRLLFVDGRSRDDSFRIVEDFKRQYDSQYSEIELIQGDFDSAAKARNECIRHLKPEEHLWFLDSDVLVTQDSLDLLVGMMDKYDISTLYYTHDRSADPPETTGIGPARSARTGCTLFSPKTIEKVGLLNERITELHGYVDDADYSLRARLLGLKIGCDEVHVQLHLKPKSKPNWHRAIDEVVSQRRYRGWWFANRVFTQRWASYFALFGFLLLMPISLLFGIPILLYFIFQLVRRRSLQRAFVVTIVALILPPTTILGYFELKASRPKTKEVTQPPNN